MTYEGERAMFEAYGRNKYTATGVVQWMLNNAWPSIIWHLYDWYLRPGRRLLRHQEGERAAARAVLVRRPLHRRRELVLPRVPGLHSHGEGLQPGPHGEILARRRRSISAKTAPPRALRLPEIEGLSKVYFVRLTLQDAAGKPVSSNFYWLSTQPDVSDWAAPTAATRRSQRTPISRVSRSCRARPSRSPRARSRKAPTRSSTSRLKTPLPASRSSSGCASRMARTIARSRRSSGTTTISSCFRAKSAR